jgi:hypothetical protein
MSAVGAADSFRGAIIWRLAAGHDLNDAIRHGAAALLNPGTELCRRKTSSALPRNLSLNLLELARCKPTLTRIGGSAGIVELLDGEEQGRHAIDGRYPVSDTPIVVDAPRECAFHDGESCRSDRNFKARAP